MPAKGSEIGYAEDVLSASASKVTNGNTAALPGYGETSTLRAQLEVTAASGTTPTLNVTIEDTIDGTNWNTIGTFAQKTGVAQEVINMTIPFADRIRVKWVVGGTTPNFTFSVKAAAQSPNV